jgi:hypothetical protein
VYATRSFPMAASTGKLDGKTFSHEISPVLNSVSRCNTVTVEIARAYMPAWTMGSGLGAKEDVRKAGFEELVSNGEDM